MKVILNKAASSAEIYLYEDIGAGWFGGVSSKEFSDELKSIGAVDTINLRLNSPGGSVFEGVAINNLLSSNPANVIVHIDGLAASIASIVAMAGDEIRMAENALMMIHDPWGLAVGTAEDMRKEADTLEVVRDTLIKTYVSRTTSEEEQISEWMQAETWMNADEAKERGFADQITEEMKQAACIDCSRYKYRNAPTSQNQAGENRPLYKVARSRIAHMQSRLRRRKM